MNKNIFNAALVTAFGLILMFLSINGNKEEINLSSPRLTAGVCDVFLKDIKTAEIASVELINVENTTLAIDVLILKKERKKEEDLYCGLSEEEFNYFCKAVESEAGDQDFLGRCYVADCILNRLDEYRDRYGLETITDVINQRLNGDYMFTVVSNGRIHKAVPTEDTVKAVRQELKCRTNTEILSFQMGGYHSFGHKAFKHGTHYFNTK